MSTKVATQPSTPPPSLGPPPPLPSTPPPSKPVPAIPSLPVTSPAPAAGPPPSDFFIAIDEIIKNASVDTPLHRYHSVKSSTEAYRLTVYTEVLNQLKIIFKDHTHLDFDDVDLKTQTSIKSIANRAAWTLALEADWKSSKAEAEKYKKQHQDVGLQLAGAQIKIGETAALLQSATENLKRAEDLNTTLQAKVKDLTDANTRLESSARVCGASVALAQGKEQTLQNENNVLRQTIAQLQTDNRNLSADKDAIQTAADIVQIRERRLQGDLATAHIRIQELEKNDTNAALRAAEQQNRELKQQLDRESAARVSQSHEALEAVRQLRRAPKLGDADTKHTYSLAYLEALQSTLGGAAAIIREQNGRIEEQMMLVLNRGTRDPSVAQALNMLRSTLVNNNGGRLVRSNADGSIVWAFSASRDAKRVEDILNRAGFRVEIEKPLSSSDIGVRQAQKDPAELIRLADQEQVQETLLITNSYSTTITPTTTASSFPSSNPEEWLTQRCAQLLSKANQSRSSSVSDVSKLLAQFLQGSVRESDLGMRSLVFHGDDRSRAAAEASRVLDNTGIRHLDPVAEGSTAVSIQLKE